MPPSQGVWPWVPCFIMLLHFHLVGETAVTLSLSWMMKWGLGESDHVQVYTVGDKTGTCSSACHHPMLSVPSAKFLQTLWFIFATPPPPPTHHHPMCLSVVRTTKLWLKCPLRQKFGFKKLINLRAENEESWVCSKLLNFLSFEFLTRKWGQPLPGHQPENLGPWSSC